MLHLLDEVMDLGQLGVALLWMETSDEPRPYPGMKLRDARGNIHTVSAVTSEENLCTLLIPDGDASYFGRLFRDIRIQADVFEEVD